MASEDIKKFTQKMLSKKVFSCVICNHLLKSPVMITDDGNVCRKCIENSNETLDVSVPNAALDTLLKELKFPCKYASEGCGNDILHENLPDHENKCMYRSMKCLLTKEECEWFGKVIDLYKHFIENHASHVVSGPFNEFYFDFNLSKNLNIIKLLNNKTMMYFIKITEMESDVLNFLQDIKIPNNAVELNIKYVGDNGEHKIKILPLTFNADFNKNNAQKLLLSTLKEITGLEQNVKVYIKSEKREIKNLNSEVLKYLECAVCKDLMRPPILQCITGHSICKACRNRIKECPTCRQGYSYDTRNFSFEALTSSVLYTCANRQFGCMGTFLGLEIDRHEENCTYKVYTCPINECNFIGNYLLCQNHFKTNHAESLIEGFKIDTSFTPLASGMSTTTVTKYFFQHGNIYEYKFTRSNSLCSWNICILNRYDSSKKYYFVVTIKNPRVKQRQLIKSNLCQSKKLLCDTDKVTFSYNDLNVFKNSENDQIHFKCEILEPMEED